MTLLIEELRAKSKSVGPVDRSRSTADVEKRAIKRPTLGDQPRFGRLSRNDSRCLPCSFEPVREIDSDSRRIIGLGIDNETGKVGSGDFDLDFYGDTRRWNESTAVRKGRERMKGGELLSRSILNPVQSLAAVPVDRSNVLDVARRKTGPASPRARIRVRGRRLCRLLPCGVMTARLFTQQVGCPAPTLPTP